jgi:hypothetical protein
MKQVDQHCCSLVQVLLQHWMLTFWVHAWKLLLQCWCLMVRVRQHSGGKPVVYVCVCVCMHTVLLPDSTCEATELAAEFRRKVCCACMYVYSVVIWGSSTQTQTQTHIHAHTQTKQHTSGTGQSV